MRCIIRKQELQEKLADIQNIVEKRTTMPVLSHFLMNVSKKGSSITATDIETAIREPIEASVEREGRLAMPARKLFEIVREVEGDITLEAEDMWLRAGAGASNFRLACLSPEEFPAWPAMEKSEEVSVEPAMLGQMIDKTIYSAGESDTRYALNGLLFSLEGGSLTLVGTDGHRLALIEKQLSSPVNEASKVIVPRKTASELRKFLDRGESLTINIGKNHILFKVGDTEFLARLIEGTYPNFGQVIPPANEKILGVEREGFMKALRRVSVMSRERSNAIKVDIDSGRMTLSSSNPDIGEARDEVAVEYTGAAFALGFNARYLLDVLAAMTAEKVQFELQDQLSPTLLKEAGNDSYKCVVMPMRI